MANDPTHIAEAADCAHHHLRLGWWMLLLFIVMGLSLEALHGFKVGYYLDVSNQTRRYLWTLGHAYGALLGLLNIAFAFSVNALPAWRGASRLVASRCLIGASILMPSAFVLGGVVIYSGDPGLGIFLLPVGGGLLFAAVWLVARGSAIRWPSRGERGRG